MGSPGYCLCRRQQVLISESPLGWQCGEGVRRLPGRWLGGGETEQWVDLADTTEVKLTGLANLCWSLVSESARNAQVEIHLY